MLDDAQRPALREIEDLARLAAPKALGAGQVTAVPPAHRGRMLEPLVRHRDRLESRPRMPSWPPCRRPDERRRLRRLGSTGGFVSPSEDGGREELRELA